MKHGFLNIDDITNFSKQILEHSDRHESVSKQSYEDVLLNLNLTRVDLYYVSILFIYLFIIESILTLL